MCGVFPRHRLVNGMWTVGCCHGVCVCVCLQELHNSAAADASISISIWGISCCLLSIPIFFPVFPSCPLTLSIWPVRSVVTRRKLTPLIALRECSICHDLRESDYTHAHTIIYHDKVVLKVTIVVLPFKLSLLVFHRIRHAPPTPGDPKPTLILSVCLPKLLSVLILAPDFFLCFWGVVWPDVSDMKHILSKRLQQIH